MAGLSDHGSFGHRSSRSSVGVMDERGFLGRSTEGREQGTLLLTGEVGREEGEVELGESLDDAIGVGVGGHQEQPLGAAHQAMAKLAHEPIVDPERRQRASRLGVGLGVSLALDAGGDGEQQRGAEEELPERR